MIKLLKLRSKSKI